MRHNLFLSLILTFFLLIAGCSSSTMSNLENPLPKCPSSPNCKRVSLTLENDSSSVFTAFEEVFNELNAENIISNKSVLRIDAVFKIPIFGYRDDVAVQIHANGSASQVFIRSASREGHWDIWVNTIRVNHLIKNVKRNLSN